MSPNVPRNTSAWQPFHFAQDFARQGPIRSLILQGGLEGCIIWLIAEVGESLRVSPRSHGWQEGWEGPLERYPPRGAPRDRPQGCPGTVEEETLRRFAGRERGWLLGVGS